MNSAFSNKNNKLIW